MENHPALQLHPNYFKHIAYYYKNKEKIIYQMPSVCPLCGKYLPDEDFQSINTLKCAPKLAKKLYAAYMDRDITFTNGYRLNMYQPSVERFNARLIACLPPRPEDLIETALVDPLILRVLNALEGDYGETPQGKYVRHVASKAK